MDGVNDSVKQKYYLMKHSWWDSSWSLHLLFIGCLPKIYVLIWYFQMDLVTALIAPVAQLHNILTAYIAAWLQICNNQNASELGL